MNQNKIQLSIRIPKPLSDELNQLCKQLYLNRTQITTKALEYYLPTLRFQQKDIPVNELPKRMHELDIVIQEILQRIDKIETNHLEKGN